MSSISTGRLHRARDGRISCRRGFLATLHVRQVARVGAEMDARNGLPLRAVSVVESVSGEFALLVGAMSDFGSYASMPR